MSLSLSHFDYVNPPDRSQSGWTHGVAHFRAFLVTLCVLLVIATLGISYMKKAIHNELRVQIAAIVNQRLSQTDFLFELDEASWVEGQGLSLREIRVLDKRSHQVIGKCRQLYARSTFQLTDMLSAKPRIENLTLDGLHVFCQRNAEGQWNIVELLQAMQCDSPMLELDCPIQIRNSQASIEASTLGWQEPIEIRGIHCDYLQDATRVLSHQFKGFLSTAYSSRLDFAVNVDETRGSWSATGESSRIDIDERLAGLLAKTGEQASLLKSLRGQVSIRFAVAGRFHDLAGTRFQAAGRAANLQCLDNTLPHQIHDGSFEFQVANLEGQVPQLRIQNAQCRVGYGTVRGDVLIIDPLQRPQYRVRGQVQSFRLTERLLPWMRPAVQQAWHQFQPTGVIDAAFDVEWADGKITRNVQASMNDGSFSWFRFPYRVSGCNGSIQWVGDQLCFDLTAIEAQQLIKLKGDILNPGPDWSGWLEGESDGHIPINEKLLQAFDSRPELARTLRKFNATGHVNGWGRVERVAGSNVIDKTFDIQLLQATVRHESFNYPIYNVNGLIHVANDKTEFRSLLGQNNNGRIECHGNWTRNHGLQLRFLANNVLLNDELRDALPANLRQTWRGLRPQGIVDFVDLDLHTVPGNPRPLIGVTVEIPRQMEQESSVSINPIWFPYEMRQVTGKFRFENQRIDIQSFTARHGKTTITANGSGFFDDQNWRLRFSDVFASNIVLDNELRHALPTAVAMGLDRIKFQGNLGMQGALELTGIFAGGWNQATAETPADRSWVSTHEPQSPSANLSWNLDFGIARASATIGVPITNANGVVQLRGRYAAGQVECFGRLLLDSLIYRGIQVTSLNAPVSMDNETIGVGALAAVEQPQTVSEPGTAVMFGGKVLGDAQLSLSGDNEFYVQAILSDARLEQFAAEISMQQHDYSGLAFAGIRLRGNASGTHSIRGNGNIQLRNAKIYEVPVIVALLNVLRIKEPDRTAFDQAQMDFTVNGENFDFQKIELNGDAISLIGQGTLNLDSEVELDFYTVMGRNRWFIPVLTKLYQAGSKQVWWIEVDGTLDNPQTKHQILPGLNDSLKRLFPELEESTGQ